MTLKQAIKIVESHNRWRRDNNVPPKTKMASPAELGKALDVLLIVAKDYCKLQDMDRVQIKPKKRIKMSLEERIENGTTELQDYYRIAIRDIEKHKANITRLNIELKKEQGMLYKACELKCKCKLMAEEQGYYNLFK